jgi:hypothetical protein
VRFVVDFFFAAVFLAMFKSILYGLRTRYRRRLPRSTIAASC